MRIPHLLFAMTIGPHAVMGCQPEPEPNRVEEGPNSVTPSDQSERPGPIGLPDMAADADCEAPYQLDFATWVHGADAIFVGDVVAVHLNDEIVYSGETPVEFADCERENVSAGLRIELSNVDFMTAGSTTVPTEVFVGENYAATWSPQPYYVPATHSIAWSGQGAVIGTGLKLGVAAFYDTDLNVWYAGEYSLFEIEPSGEVLMQDSPCVEFPPSLQNVDRARLSDAVTAAAPPDASALAQYRDRFAPDDSTFRARYGVATHCLLKDRPPDPVTPDPEADAL